jgi:hypothetical protein
LKEKIVKKSGKHGDAQVSSSNDSLPPPTGETRAEKHLKLINKQRGESGLPPLDGFARDLAAKDWTSHAAAHEALLKRLRSEAAERPAGVPLPAPKGSPKLR